MPRRSATPLIRFAVLGAGSIGREFALEHLTKEAGTTVTAVVDLDAGKAQALAIDVGSMQAGAALGGRGYRASAASACGEPVRHATALDAAVLDAADAVYIGTTPASHAALVHAALAAKKHVLLEKPLAATREDADAIVAAAEEAARAGLHVGVNIGMRWNEALARMRSLAVDDVTPCYGNPGTPAAAAAPHISPEHPVAGGARRARLRVPAWAPTRDIAPSCIHTLYLRAACASNGCWRLCAATHQCGGLAPPRVAGGWTCTTWNGRARGKLSSGARSELRSVAGPTLR